MDASGIALAGKTVNFGLSTAVGGVTLSTLTGISDALGQVYVTVNSGTINTPVRVTASTITNPAIPLLPQTLTTQSDQLVITTGIPDQQNFSLSATIFNIEGWNIDGATTVITARLADHFNNPVLDGTAVTFTTEGGHIIASCNTVAGACSTTLTSAALRPLNGRVTVLAYALGEEGFTDLNGNGLADQLLTKQLAPLPPSPEMVDANGLSTDLPEAWVDYNENGIRDALTEPFIDFNGNGLYDAADTLYNGVICDHTLAVNAPSVANPLASLACSLKQSLHIFKSLTIVFSSSTPAAPTVSLATLNLGGCVGGAIGAGATTQIQINDVNLNLMPAGTTIAVSLLGNGKLVSPASYIVPNGIATNLVGILTKTVAGTLLPVPTIPPYGITVASDATLTVTPANPAAVPPTLATSTCTDTTVSGTLTVTVTTPGAGGIGGTVSVYTLPVIN